MRRLVGTTARAKPRRRPQLLPKARASGGTGHCAGPFLFWSDPGASEKNHNRLRLVSGSEYRMAVDQDRALLASELLQLTRERRGVMGVQWRILNLWSLKCRLFKEFPMSSQNLRNSPLFYRAGLLKREWGQLVKWAAAGDGTQ
jgi:hypothetical protein